MKLIKRNPFVFLLAVLSLSVLVRAQDYDDDDDEGPTFASLSLRFEKQGGAAVDFLLPKPHQDLDSIREGVAATLNCPASSFRSPAPTPSTFQTPLNWAAKDREQYLRILADYSRRHLTANCASMVRVTSFGREATIDLSSLAARLKQEGLSQLSVVIFLPAASHIEFSPENLSSAATVNHRFASYQIALDSSSGQIPPIHFFYGWSREAIFRNFYITFAFILCPLAITLWMRRLALSAGRIDPMAAWFSYFRTLNWCIQGSMLLWITSGLGARQALQDWVSYLLAPGWKLTLLDIAIAIGPAFLVYFLCLAASYRLHVQLRGTKWTRREFLLQQLVNVGAQALPWMFFLAAIENVTLDARATAGFFIAGLVSLMLFANLKMWVTKTYPHTLTTGELRDRVFAIANKARVKINQVIVLPTGKGQVANAYATGNRTVMFTDYLLHHLTKREVEGVAAHEVAHLQFGHVKKRVLAFYAVIIGPGLLGVYLGRYLKRPQLAGSAGLAGHLQAGLVWFWNWPQRDFVLILLGLSLFYLLSRRFEFEADRGGAALTGDAEAQITGLLKLSRLNLMPIQWGRGTGSWMTHPSTLRRAKRIAAASGMSSEQLHAILDSYKAELKTTANTEAAPLPVDHYSVPEVHNPENFRSALSKQKLQQIRLWALLLMHVVPPGAVALWVHTARLEGTAALLAYLTGFALTPLLCTIFGGYLGIAGRRGQRRRLAERFEREGLNIGEKGIAVGFSPGAVVRFYGLNSYNWDIGFLMLSGNRLSYVGEQIRFSLPAEQILGICVGQGGPSWWKFPRIYIRWKQEDGTPAAFSVASLEPCSMWKLKKRAAELHDKIRNLRVSNPGELRAPELPPLKVGEVTSKSPRKLGNLQTNLGVLVYLVPLAVVVNAPMHTNSVLYLLSTIVFTRLVGSIPYWRFRDRLLQFTPLSNVMAAKSGS